MASNDDREFDEWSTILRRSVRELTEITICMKMHDPGYRIYIMLRNTRERNMIFSILSFANAWTLRKFNLRSCYHPSYHRWHPKMVSTNKFNTCKWILKIPLYGGSLYAILKFNEYTYMYELARFFPSRF